MKCCSCKRNIAAGVDAQKMIVEYAQPDATTKVFGYLMSDGPLSKATGQILRAWHHKCFHVQRKREAKGDAVTGRVLQGMPTGYEIADAEKSGTRYLSERLDKLREIAKRIGKAVGDPTVTEAFAAEEHGGPYPHAHHLRLDAYQLMAHLRYAHGCTDDPAGYGGSRDDFHRHLHARMVLEHTTEVRQADPSFEDTPERDWRDQAVMDI